MSQSNAAQLATQGVAVTSFHKALFDAMQACRKSAETMHSRMAALLDSKYGNTSPTYEQFRADRIALARLADERGLKDDQWIRKPYNAAVKAKYGELPKAPGSKVQGPKKGNGKPGAVKGETAPRTASERETLEQYISRIGVFKVLTQCALILEADDSTKMLAETIKHLKAA